MFSQRLCVKFFETIILVIGFVYILINIVPAILSCWWAVKTELVSSLDIPTTHLKRDAIQQFLESNHKHNLSYSFTQFIWFLFFNNISVTWLVDNKYFHKRPITVNSNIFKRVLFSRNFTYAKFRENKILAKWRNHSVVN